MNVSIDKADVRIEGGKLIITINSDLEEVLGLEKVPLSSVDPGTVVDGDLIVTRHIDDDTTEVWSKDLIGIRMEFGSTNDWRDSPIRKFLNGDYLKKLEERFGAGNIVPHCVDLMSMDGLRDYGECLDRVSVPTLDEYRRSRDVLGKVINEWWWLATPNSAPSGDGNDIAHSVSPDGVVFSELTGCENDVRCVFHLKSSVMVYADK